MAEMTVLSVVVCAYNMEAYLERCLKSVLGVPGVEVLVVDDGSTDRTAAVAAQLGARVLSKPNGHYGSCINAAIAAVTGEFIKTLDADDTFARADFERFVALLRGQLQAGTAADCYLTDYDEVDETDTPFAGSRFALKPDAVASLGEIRRLEPLPTMHSFTYRTAFLRRLGYRQTEGIPYTDNDWILYPLLAAGAAYYSPLRVYRYFYGREGQSVSFESRRRNFAAYGLLVRRMCEFRRSPAGRSLAGDALAYFEFSVVAMARQYCETLYFLAPRGEVASALPALAAELDLSCPGLYAQVEESALILKQFGGVRYLRWWRRLGPLKGAWVVASRLAVRLATAAKCRGGKGE